MYIYTCVHIHIYTHIYACIYLKAGCVYVPSRSKIHNIPFSTFYSLPSKAQEIISSTSSLPQHATKSITKKSIVKFTTITSIVATGTYHALDYLVIYDHLKKMTSPKKFKDIK